MYTSTGNAKTIRNDNSSRFGRFMQVCFDPKYKIKGCVIQDYLLEQSRITTQASNERNYHIFYQLTAAAEVRESWLDVVTYMTSMLRCVQRDKDLRERFLLSGPRDFAYLNTSGCIVLDGVDDAARFDGLRLAFEVVQIPEEKIQGVISVVAAILWLGNLDFQVQQNVNVNAQLFRANIVVANTSAFPARTHIDQYQFILGHRE